MEPAQTPPDPDAAAYVRRWEPDEGVPELVDRLLRRFADAGRTRRAVARVNDGEQLIEISSALGGRWTARTSLVEWSYGPDGLTSWHIALAGARTRNTTEGRGWVHPALGLLRPELLPVWGRPGDRFRPVHVTEGSQGVILLDLAPTSGDIVGGHPLDPGGSLYLDTGRLLVTLLELGTRSWTLEDYTDL